MARKKSVKNQNNALSSILGSDVVLKGTLSLNGSMRIDGEFSGDLVSGGIVSIGNSARFTGNLEASEVVLGGKFKGTLVAKEKLVIESSAILEGDIATTRLVIGEGARFEGKSGMGKASVERLLISQGKLRKKDNPDSEDTSSDQDNFDNQNKTSVRKGIVLFEPEESQAN